MDTTESFFEELARRKHDPLMERVKGTFCFDLAQGEKHDHYELTINKGDIVVSHEHGQPDCSVSADRKLFNRIMLGEASALAAALRGDLQFHGDPGLILLVFQRLFCQADNFIQDQTDLAGGERRRR
jgi:putative sterol carrier protein